MITDTRDMERMRDLQAEVGAVLDRFHSAGLPAHCILDVMSAESEIWLARAQRDEFVERSQAAAAALKEGAVQ